MYKLISLLWSRRSTKVCNKKHSHKQSTCTGTHTHTHTQPRTHRTNKHLMFVSFLLCRYHCLLSFIHSSFLFNLLLFLLALLLLRCPRRCHCHCHCRRHCCHRCCCFFLFVIMLMSACVFSILSFVFFHLEKHLFLTLLFLSLLGFLSNFPFSEISQLSFFSFDLFEISKISNLKKNIQKKFVIFRDCWNCCCCCCWLFWAATAAAVVVFVRSRSARVLRCVCLAVKSTTERASHVPSRVKRCAALLLPCCCLAAAMRCDRRSDRTDERKNERGDTARQTDKRFNTRLPRCLPPSLPLPTCPWCVCRLYE